MATSQTILTVGLRSHDYAFFNFHDVATVGSGLGSDVAPLRVNTVSPGLIANTGAYQSMTDSASEEMFNVAARHLPAGRVGQPEDVAAVVVALLENPFITGSVVDIDGGGLLR